ncbi:nitrophenyl compound nitroreductase subunit ArsF family protein [Arcticibacter tournemirensis]|uniref:Thioredoxin domain-containing protein n=1 Tax=Arcticibacter tournemirensis TaxID=699437 RepID=A0A4Q0MGB2_9SPHI|nr:nitrophenyl compound nitroreductase subunit ArsF family protein [Arcticibacter tournemirensis]RXF72404.1 hypothetical protein EKH83_01360 [Arcticibacter tournemirensis]
MKKLLAVTLSIFAFATVSFRPSGSLPAASPKVEAYYFHFTSRCNTCRTIEEQAKKDIEELYPALVKKGKITFKSINLDEGDAKPLAEKLNVKAQTLLIVAGNQKVNITNEGFRYAVGQPDKFKAIIKGKIDELLKQ